MHALACTCSPVAPASNGSARKQDLRRLQTGSRVKSAALPVSPRAGPAPKPAKAGGKWCATCAGKGAIECPGCKGSGKNKKNGNLFERWKCYDCQGFGLISCKKCGAGGRGLTPEQRGER